MPSNQEVDKDAIVFGDDLELVLLMTRLNQLETHEDVVPAAQVMVHQVFQDDKGTMASKVDPYVHRGNSSSNLKVRPPNPNSNLLTNSDSVSIKIREEFLDKSTLQESCDTSRDNDKTFVMDWG